MTASEEVDCDIRGLRYVDVDTHIVAIGPRCFVAQRVLRYALDPLEYLPPSSAPPRLRLSRSLAPAVPGVTDLSDLIQLLPCPGAVVKLQSLIPLDAFNAYTLPSSEPTYTTPLATVGLDST